MIADPEQYINFLLKYKITPNQFLLCYLLYWDRKEQEMAQEEGLKRAFVWVYKYHEGVKSIYGKKGWTTEEINDLIEKGIVRRYSKASDIYPDQLEVTDKFVIAMNTRDNFAELWETYPAFHENFDDPRGPKVRLKTANYDQLERIYMRAIRTASEHIEVMKVLRWCIDNNALNIGIEKWITSRQWKEDAKRMHAPATQNNVTAL